MLFWRASKCWISWAMALFLAWISSSFSKSSACSVRQWILNTSLPSMYSVVHIHISLSLSTCCYVPIQISLASHIRRFSHLCLVASSSFIAILFFLPIAAYACTRYTKNICCRCGIRGVRGQINFREFLNKFWNKTETGIVHRIITNRNHV